VITKKQFQLFPRIREEIFKKPEIIFWQEDSRVKVTYRKRNTINTCVWEREEKKCPKRSIIFWLIVLSGGVGREKRKKEKNRQLDQRSNERKKIIIFFFSLIVQLFDRSSAGNEMRWRHTNCLILPWQQPDPFKGGWTVFRIFGRLLQRNKIKKTYWCCRQTRQTFFYSNWVASSAPTWFPRKILCRQCSGPPSFPVFFNVRASSAPVEYQCSKKPITIRFSSSWLFSSYAFRTKIAKFLPVTNPAWRKKACPKGVWAKKKMLYSARPAGV
jgi:hypothetical protein